MQPIIVMPMNDPAGVMLPHLQVITPTLKTMFTQAFLGVPDDTRAAQPAYVAWLESDDFFRIGYRETAVPVGHFFHNLYTQAASSYPPQQLLHLCFIDKVIYALQSERREAFTADIRAVTPEQTPLIFQRSAQAWETYPQNYRQLEQVVTIAGEYLFGKSLDFAWCHLVLPAGQLQACLRQVKNPDISMVAEFVLSLKDELHTKDVDWLSWEDPFFETGDPEQFRLRREQSVQETRRRLSYVIPMLQLLYEFA